MGKISSKELMSIVDELGIQVKEDSSINLDSLKFIQLVVVIEDKFNFEFDDEKLLLSAFPNLNSLEDYISKKIENIN